MFQPMTNFRNKRHLAYIRTFPCCTCGTSENIHAHHLRVNHGMGMKSGDEWVLPLCGNCHVWGVYAVHTVGSKRETEWFFSRDVDCRALAEELFASSPHQEPQKKRRKRPVISIGFANHTQAMSNRQCGDKRNPTGSIQSRGFGSQRQAFVRQAEQGENK